MYKDKEEDIYQRKNANVLGEKASEIERERNNLYSKYQLYK